MTTVRMVVFKLTVLLEDSDRDRLDHMSLEQIASEMDEGSFIGMMSVASEAIVPPADIRKTLLALGNDGSFFDDQWRETP